MLAAEVLPRSGKPSGLKPRSSVPDPGLTRIACATGPGRQKRDLSGGSADWGAESRGRSWQLGQEKGCTRLQTEEERLPGHPQATQPLLSALEGHGASRLHYVRPRVKGQEGTLRGLSLANLWTWSATAALYPSWDVMVWVGGPPQGETQSLAAAGPNCPALGTDWEGSRSAWTGPGGPCEG